MSVSVEFKAKQPNLEDAERLLAELGAARVADEEQIDTYFEAKRGRLKLRLSSAEAPCLLAYERLDSPLVREKRLEKVELTPALAERMARALDSSLGAFVTVRKKRRTFEHGPARIHLDRVAELGEYLEVEVEAGRCEPGVDPSELARELAEKLGVELADVVPWSYSDLIVMREAARKWREKLAAHPERGRLLVIDGPSCSGKSTLTHWLLEGEEFGLTLVYRSTSREPRPGEEGNSEYRFVDPERFRSMARRGEFLEYRDFEFGMSYGLPWSGVFDVIKDGGDALGVINLGNAAHVKEMLPEAITILIDAPVETIRRRLEARGSHTAGQIEERLGNARRAKSLRGTYDFVIDNDEGRLAESQAALREIVLG